MPGIGCNARQNNGYKKTIIQTGEYNDSRLDDDKDRCLQMGTTDSIGCNSLQHKKYNKNSQVKSAGGYADGESR